MAISKNMNMLKDGLLKDLSAIAFLFLSTLILCYPLLLKGYPFGDDTVIHLLWAQQFLSSLKAGYCYPQWVPDVNFGCGSTAFIFYPPFMFFTYAPISFFTKDVVTILSVSALLGMFASGVAMYVFCRAYLSRCSSLISSVLYIALPYHLVDLYARSALAEFWAFPWLPLICFFALKIKGKEFPYFIGLSISYACLVLTHLPSVLLFSPFLFSYFFFLLFQEGNWKNCLNRFLALALGVGVSFFYLIPAIAEQRYVNINALVGNAGFMFERHFLFSKLPGIDAAFNREISIIALGSFLLASVNLVFWTFRRDDSAKKLSSALSFFACSGVVSFLMMLSASKFLWIHVPLLKQVQFPWRLSLVTTFFASLSVGFSSGAIFSRSVLRKWNRSLLGLSMLGLIVFNSWHSHKVIGLLSGLSPDQIKLIKMHKIGIRTDSSYDEMMQNYRFYFPRDIWLIDLAQEYRPVWSILEYRPLWSLREVIHDGSLGNPQKQVKSWGDFTELVTKKITEYPQFDFSAEESIFYEKAGPYAWVPSLKLLRTLNVKEYAMLIPYAMLKERAILKNGNGPVTIMRWEPEYRVMHVQTTEPTEILIKTFYYPRWKAYINAKSVPVSPDPVSALIRVAIPKGQYDIEIRFENSVYRSIGFIVSIISMGILLFPLLGKKLRMTPGKED